MAVCTILLYWGSVRSRPRSLTLLLNSTELEHKSPCISFNSVCVSVFSREFILSQFHTEWKTYLVGEQQGKTRYHVLKLALWYILFTNTSVCLFTFIGQRVCRCILMSVCTYVWSCVCPVPEASYLLSPMPYLIFCRRGGGDCCDQSNTAQGSGKSVCVSEVCVGYHLPLPVPLFSIAAPNLCRRLTDEPGRLFQQLRLRGTSDGIDGDKKIPKNSLIWLKDKNRELHIITQTNPCSSQL